MRRIVLTLTLLLAACTSPATWPEHDPLPKWVTESTSVDGRPLRVAIVGDGDEVVLYLATIHGNERAGTPLLELLIERLTADPTLLANRRAVIVPLVNPDGAAAKTRRNAHGIDLNRNFPARNFLESPTHGPRTLSEPESLFVYRVIDYFEPMRIVSIHQPAERIDYDGPAVGLAYRLAEVSPLEVRRLGARPGSLGSWAGRDQGIPVITLELPADAGELPIEELWELHAPLLLAALSEE